MPIVTSTNRGEDGRRGQAILRRPPNLCARSSSSVNRPQPSPQLVLASATRAETSRARCSEMLTMFARRRQNARSPRTDAVVLRSTPFEPFRDHRSRPAMKLLPSSSPFLLSVCRIAIAGEGSISHQRSHCPNSLGSLRMSRSNPASEFEFELAYLARVRYRRDGPRCSCALPTISP